MTAPLAPVLAITYADVEAAATRLRGVAHLTPVLTSRTADERSGARLFFKCENFQRMGAFKFRGAYNALAQFTPEQRRGGVIAFSSGNHAQAIALSARLLGMPSLRPGTSSPGQASTRSPSPSAPATAPTSSHASPPATSSRSTGSHRSTPLFPERIW